MKQNGQLLNFLVETVKRLFTKSPAYFKVLALISTVAFVLTGLPGLIEDISSIFGNAIHLPEWTTALASKAAGWGSFLVLLTSLLTTESTPVAIAPSGSVLKKTDKNALPFTAVEEAKAENKPGGLLNAGTDTERVTVAVKAEA